MRAGQITEWVGGRIAFPAKVESLPGGIAEMTIWVELPSQLVVGHTLEDPSAPETSFGQSLMRAMSSPLVGEPRRPKTVRVADAALARELEGFSFLTVEVGPTPELEAVARSLDSFFGKGSYFSDPTITPEDVAALFAAARELWAGRPWEIADERCLIQLDSTELGLDEAAVSIVGGLGEVRGFVLFPSIDDVDLLREEASEPDEPDEPDAHEEPKRLTHSALYFSFDAAVDVPAAMREEVAAHGFQLADPDAYPVLMRMVDGRRAPVSRTDLQCASAVARVVSVLVQQQADAFELDSELVAEGTMADVDGREIHFVIPHSELDEEDLYGPQLRRAETLDDEDNPYGLPISVGQLRQLARGLGSFTLHRLIGTFCALASVPRMVPPQAWLPEIVDGAPRASEAAVRALVEGVMQVYGAVLDRVAELGIAGLVPVETDVAACRAWALGYGSVLQKSDPSTLEDEDTDDAMSIICAVTEAPEMLAAFEQIRDEATADDATADDALMVYRYELADAAQELYDAWAGARERAAAKASLAAAPVRRDAPKVGRNDPCPCGSGKKFKKCCG